MPTLTITASKSVSAALFLAWAGALLPSNAAAQDTTIRFKDVTEQAGLKQPLAGIMGHGGAWGDVDGDGRPDLFVGGFSDRPVEEYHPATAQVPARLFRNTGDGFVEWQPETTRFHGRISGALFADFNNDGTLELYSANNARPQSRHTDEIRGPAQRRLSNFFKNENGKLVDISRTSGACPEGMRSARNIGALDYNRDGLLDLLVVEDVFTKNPRTLLLKNLGDLKFEVANDEVGLPNDVHALGLAVADINLDGQPDFFLPHSNRMFFSGKDGKYHEGATLTEPFAWKNADREEWPCGAAFADLNRDGRLDLVLSIHYQQARNKVYLNEGVKGGVPQFRDVTEAVGLGKTVPQKCPHVEVQDFDNDGYPDIYMSAAWLDEKGNVTPLIYRNHGLKNGLPQFVPNRPIGDEMVYYPAGPSADYNNDGKLDLFLINWFQGNHCRLMQNATDAGNWLDVHVQGTKMNRMGLGAKVSIYPAGKLGQAASLLGHQEMTIGYGYASGQEAVCHFGLADLNSVDVLVELPSGARLTRTGVPANQALTITEAGE